jgi:hypothetical protein
VEVKELKVVLTKEQANAIEIGVNAYVGGKENFIKMHITDGFWSGAQESLNGMPLDILIRALYVGYEIEPSPEEKIIKIYQEAQVFYKKNIAEASGSFHAGQLDGIRITLDLFNLNVKGVNC